MEKYTKENMVELNHDELEHAILELQQKLEEEKENSKMYQEWWGGAKKECDGMKEKLDVISKMIKTWE